MSEQGVFRLVVRGGGDVVPILPSKESEEAVIKILGGRFGNS